MIPLTDRRTAEASGAARWVSVRYPALGLLATLSGTLCAIFLTPHDPTPRGALLWSGVAMALGLIAAPARAFFRQARSMIRGEHLLALAPVYWLLLDLITGAYDLDRVGRSEVIATFAAIGLFVASLGVGSIGKPWKLPGSIERAAHFDVGAGAWFGLAVLAFCLGMFRFAYATGFDAVEMIANLGVGRWSAPWQRGAAGGWEAFLDHLAYFGYLLPSLAVVLGHRCGWRSTRALLASAFAATFLLFVAQGGGRRTVGVMLGMALVLWLLLQRRFGLRGTLVVVTVAVGLLVGMQYMLVYRNVGFAAAGVPQQLGAGSSPGVLRVDDNFLRTAQVIDLVPEVYPHTGLRHLVYVLVRPIPRVFWPGKPMDPGFDLAYALGMPGVSLSTSIVGESYLLGGFLAVAALGWFYGRLAVMGARLLEIGELGSFVLYGAWIMALFAGFRSLLDLVLFSYVVLAWIAVVWLARRFGVRRRVSRKFVARPSVPRA